MTSDGDFTKLRRMSRVDRTRFQFDQQRQWVKDCEANGVSYTGPNGVAIRWADLAKLNQLASELHCLTGQNPLLT